MLDIETIAWLYEEIFLQLQATIINPITPSRNPSKAPKPAPILRFLPITPQTIIKTILPNIIPKISLFITYW